MENTQMIRALHVFFLQEHENEKILLIVILGHDANTLTDSSHRFTFTVQVC